MLMNYYRHIDRKKVQFDFLVHRSERGAYDDEIESLGGKIYRTYPLKLKSLPAYLKWLDTFFRDHVEYKIVHAHLDSLSTFALWRAKKNHIPVRIAHSHCNSFDNDRKLPFRLLSKQMLKFVATDYFACSKEAGDFMFGRNAKTLVLDNAIDIVQYRFSLNRRQEERNKLCLRDDDFVVGHVGRFSAVKNHKFLIDVFYKLRYIKPKSKLVLVGKGELQDDIKRYVAEKRLIEDVVFLGERPDVAFLMNIFDVFVLPSFYEGLGICLIEAQANGLHCITADTVSKEATVTENIEYLSLQLSATEWARRIIQYKGAPRLDACDQVKEAGYDIAEKAKWLEDYYCAE